MFELTELAVVVVSVSVYVLGAATVGLWMLVGPVRSGRYNGGVPPIYGSMFAWLAAFAMVLWPVVFVVAPVLNFVFGPWLDRGMTSSAARKSLHRKSGGKVTSSAKPVDALMACIPEKKS